MHSRTVLAPSGALIVEDNRGHRRERGAYLENMAISLDFAYDAQRNAPSLTNPFDVIVLDLIFRLDGLSFCQNCDLSQGRNARADC